MIVRKKILFCHTGITSFIQNDIDILSLDHDLILYHYKLSNSLVGKFFNIIKSFWITLTYVLKVDIVYSFFAGFHCFFPIFFAKYLNKKSIVVVGGYDAVSIPILKYGVFYNRNLLQWCVRKIYIWVDFILPVDESLVKSTNYFCTTDSNGQKVGLLNFIDNIENKIILIPTGYDSKFWKNIILHKNKNSVLAVAYVTNLNTFIAKGYDILVEVAKSMPDVHFTFIGLNGSLKNQLMLNSFNNITCLGFLEKAELRKIYSSSKVYVLPSMTEGLPNTLCEAMLCECIPIGSNVGGMSKAIGNTGFILKEKNVEILKGFINDAFKLPNVKGKDARKRIIDLFPLEKRIQSLKSLINDA